jgi:hypothetical protein
VKKFEFNQQTQYFCIDPAHLSEGLAAAEGKYSAVCVKPLDLRLKNLALDIPLLASNVDLTRLEIHPDIPIPAGEFKLLERMVHLEELKFRECGPFDYGKLQKLRVLALRYGTALTGLDKVRTLEELYLGRWNSDTLPKTIGGLSATSVRINASKKLNGVEPLCELRVLEKLMLQELPALRVGKEINKLKVLSDLHVEKCGWTDFSQLQIGALRKLFASKLESLHFIGQLKHLDDLFFWDCVDGDLAPVLEHPALTRIRFVPAKKHYTHRLSDLQSALAVKNARRA